MFTKWEHQENEKGHRSWKEKGEPQIRIVSHNSVALSSEGRLHDTCHHFKRRADVIILQDTTAKDWTNEGRPVMVKCNGFWSVQWSWNRRSEGSNKSCGVLRKEIPRLGYLLAVHFGAKALGTCGTGPAGH